jgi:hypothetical protein
VSGGGGRRAASAVSRAGLRGVAWLAGVSRRAGVGFRGGRAWGRGGGGLHYALNS